MRRIRGPGMTAGLKKAAQSQVRTASQHSSEMTGGEDVAEGGSCGMRLRYDRASFCSGETADGCDVEGGGCEGEEVDDALAREVGEGGGGGGVVAGKVVKAGLERLRADGRGEDGSELAQERLRLQGTIL
ncbi:unnamed protein product [Closterium sp. NIES-54]